MPPIVENEHDNAGLAYSGTPRPRGLLQLLGLKRAAPIAQHPPFGGMSVEPANGPGRQITWTEPQVGPLMPLASPNVQLGRFTTPYAVPTQVHALVSGPQMICGVETVRRQFFTNPMAPENPTPFFQQTLRPSFPVMTTRDGGRPGNTVGPAGAALGYGAQRMHYADATDSLAANLLGW